MSSIFPSIQIIPAEGGGGGGGGGARRGLTQYWNADGGGVVVRKGQILSATGEDLLVLTSDVAIDEATEGVGGLDSTTLTGTATINAGTASVAGAGTAFLTEFNPGGGEGHLLTRTGSSAGTTVTLDAAPSPAWNEVAIGDLVGNATDGYYRVTQVTDANTVEVTSAPSFGAATTLYRIESPTIEFDGSESLALDTITSNTAATTVANAAATHTGVSIKRGTLYDGVWSWAWVIGGDSGVSCVLSQQRTTPFLPTGYDTAYRRLLAVQTWDGALAGRHWVSGSASRPDPVEYTPGRDRWLSGYTGGAFSLQTAEEAVPPTSHYAECRILQQGSSSALNCNFRVSGSSDPNGVGANVYNASANTAPVPFLGQGVEVKVSSGTWYSEAILVHESLDLWLP